MQVNEFCAKTIIILHRCKYYIFLPDCCTNWAQDFAVATTVAVAFVTFRDACDSSAKLSLFREAFTRLATTSCAVPAATLCDATINLSNLPSPLTASLAASLLETFHFN